MSSCFVAGCGLIDSWRCPCLIDSMMSIFTVRSFRWFYLSIDSQQISVFTLSGMANLSYLLGIPIFSLLVLTYPLYMY